MPFPLLFHTYLAAEILAPFYASFFILTSVLFLGKLIPLLPVLLDFGIGFGDLVRLCAYIAPQLLLFSLPMALMIGVIAGFARLSNDNEILAFKAAGTGLSRMLPVVVGIGVAVSLLTAMFSIYLQPTGNIALEKLLFQLAKEKIDKGMQERRFSERLGNIVYYAEHIDPDTRKWEGVYVSDTRDHMTPLTIIAESGALEADAETMQLTLTLANGTLQRNQNETSQDMQFERYVLQLPWEAPVGVQADISGKRSLSQQQLAVRAQELGVGTSAGASMLIEYHIRLVLSVGCFILALLGFPLGFMAGPGRRNSGVVLGLFLFVVYYILISAAKSLSEGLVVPVGLAMWLPNIVFAMLTFSLIRMTAKETIVDFLDRISAVMYRAVSPVRVLFCPRISPIEKIQPMAIAKEVSPVEARELVSPEHDSAVRANPSSKVFHHRSCRYYQGKGNTVRFRSGSEALQAGYRACRFCKQNTGENKEQGELW